MDDKYLDNVFREKLELSQQHDFDESAWLDLESRLEDKRKRKSIPWRWLAAAGILLPMLMMSFYFYYELRQTEQQLAKLEMKMNKLFKKKEAKTNGKVDKETSLAMNDNMVENILIIRQSATRPKSMKSETLKYSTKVVDESATNEHQSNVVYPATSPQIIKKEINRTITNTTEGVSKSDEDNTAFPTTALTKTEKNRNAENAFFLDSKDKIAINDSKRKGVVTNLNHFNLNFINHRVQKKENLWTRATEYFLPVGFEVSVGAFAGTQVPTSEPLATIQSRKPYFKNNGIEVAANFINGVDLTIGANIAKYSYKTTTINQDFPNVEPNTPGDIFNNLTVTEDVVQIPVGLKYNFGHYNDVFAPFVEIGGIAKRSSQRHHRFEYLPIARGNEPYAILPKPQQITDNFVMNTASVSGGLKWNPNIKNQIMDNVVIQAEAFVNADFEPSQTAWTAGIGLSANYMF